MKLNNKGYMLVEIVLSSVIAFTIAYFLINLTYKFKDTSESIYNSISFDTFKSLVTKNIMNDLERGTVSSNNWSNSSSSITFDFKIPKKDNPSEIETEKRKLLVSGGSITYGKLNASGAYVINDISYFKKEIPKSLMVTDIEAVTNVTGFYTVVLKVNSLYNDEEYDIKLLLRK